MPAKVIMLMHANGERDSNDGEEKWCSSYTRGLVRKYDKSIRGRFAYIFSYFSFIFIFISLFLSFFYPFVFFFHISISFARIHLFADRWRREFSTRVTVHSNKLFFMMRTCSIFSSDRRWIDQAVNKKKNPLFCTLFLSVTGHFHPSFPPPFPPPFFNAF